MTYTADVFSSIEDIFAAVAQELSVLLAFAASFYMWRRLGVFKKPRVPQKQNVKTIGNQATSTAKTLRSSSNEEMAGVKKAARYVEKQLTQLLEQREFTRALNIYRTAERDGREQYFVDENFYSLFIQSAIRVGKVDVVERLLRCMRRKGMAPTRDFWRSTLKMLSSRKHFSTCLSAYASYSSVMPADKVAFSCLVNAALEIGEPQRAKTLLDSYCKCDLEPRDYVLVFRTYVALNDVEAAEVTFGELGKKMTPLMLNLLLLTCVNSQRPEHALKLLQDAQELEEMCDRADALESSQFVDAISYNTVIKGFAQAKQLDRCIDCLRAMRQRGLEPDDITFGTILEVVNVALPSLVQDGRMDGSDDDPTKQVIDLLVTDDKPIDKVMCTQFIKGLVRADRVEQAMQLYHEIKRRGGICPDLVTYSVLIKACVDVHDLEKALLFVQDMAEANLRPDDIILTHLLEGCRFLGNHALGKRLFEDMVKAGVRLSEFTLIAMVKLHGRCGAHEEAYELVANWEKKHGLKPSVVHYTCLMSGCMRTKSYDQAWKAYELMLQNGVALDETALATLLTGLAGAHQWERLVSLVGTSLKAQKHAQIPTETLNNALAQMLSADGAKAQAEAKKLEALMQERGILISARSSHRCA
mmetsp:Transcript_142370/g.265330  ORF Transcript_142370/g.265330 Transcript_142370/m.265330 type:complete len:642 (-) Transcript_142370:19-1944(-)